jgi:hypothetical protein
MRYFSEGPEGETGNWDLLIFCWELQLDFMHWDWDSSPKKPIENGNGIKI